MSHMTLDPRSLCPPPALSRPERPTPVLQRAAKAAGLTAAVALLSGMIGLNAAFLICAVGAF